MTPVGEFVEQKRIKNPRRILGEILAVRLNDRTPWILTRVRCIRCELCSGRSSAECDGIGEIVKTWSTQLKTKYKVYQIHHRECTMEACVRSEPGHGASATVRKLGANEPRNTADRALYLNVEYCVNIR